jgi:hypothetical protein
MRISKKESNREAIASYSMKVVLLVTIVLAFWKREWIWVLMTIVGTIIAFIPTILKRDIKITLPWSVELLIAGVLALNMGGILLDAYYIIPGYAGLFQFFTSILVAFFAFAIIFILDIYWDGLMMDKYAMAFVVVVTTMASASILEFVKWFQIFGRKSETVEQVLASMLISTFAGVVMALIGVSLIRKGKFELMTEDLGKQLSSRFINK